MSAVPQEQQAPGNGGIGSLPIDPGAEPTQNLPATVSAQDETDFYKQAGIHERLRHNEQNLGFLGKFFGSNASAPTNIAGLVVICSLIILVISLFFTGNTEMAEARKWLIGLITSALSFIFGAASKR